MTFGPQQRGDVVPEPTAGTRAVDQDYVGHGRRMAHRDMAL